MAWNNARTANPVTMDSRKFLGALNESAQAKLTFFEDHVKEMGKQVKRDYRLTALFAKELYFEDTQSKQFYQADHFRQHGKVVINNIRPIQIVEQEKKGLFEDSCLKLIDAIEENDQRGMQAAFNRMKAQRFSGRAIPESGMVRCRDGVTRHIKLHNESINEGAFKERIVKAIVEHYQNKVLVEDGRVVAGYFGEGLTELPITKWAGRKLVARKMREAAMDAYLSEGFQNRIVKLAGLVSAGKIEEAVKYVAPFLKENEEFTLLGSKRTKTLLENAMAARGVFNQRLIDDMAVLFHRTNMKVNRDTILAEWKNIAKNAEHPILVENVMTLSESKNFENSYDKFVGVVFETMSNKDVAAQALATTLEVLRDKTPRIKESADLSGKLTNLISRLQRPDYDDSAIFEAEDLIATIQEELAANDTLSSFDEIPGDTTAPAEKKQEGGQQPVVININAPLVQTGGQAGAEEPMGGEMDLGGPEADAELDALLNEPEPLAPPAPAAAAAPAAGTPAAPVAPAPAPAPATPRAESAPRHGNPINESGDPYAEIAVEISRSMADYGAPAIKDTSALQRIVNIMQEGAKHGLKGNSVAEAVEELAVESIKQAGYKIPANQLDATVERVIELFKEESESSDAHKAKRAKMFFTRGNKKKAEDGGDKASSGKPWEKEEADDEKEGVEESQRKLPSIKKRGLHRSALASESIKWNKNVGEFKGVTFLIEQDASDTLVVSEDRETSIPVPANISAKPGSQDPQFRLWLEESLDQLEPMGDEEGEDFDQAVITIKASPDGGLEVNTTGDVDVDQEMKPVDSIVADGESAEFDSETEDMPDFGTGAELPDTDGEGSDLGEEGMDDEKGGDDEDEMPEGLGEMGAEDDAESDDLGGDDDAEDDEEGQDEDEGDDEDEGLAEDKDIVSGSSAKFKKHAGDNKRDVAKSTMPKFTGDDLEGIGPEVKKDDGTGTKGQQVKSGE